MQTTYPRIPPRPLRPVRHVSVAHLLSPLPSPARPLRYGQHLRVTFTLVVPSVALLVTPRSPAREVRLRNVVPLPQLLMMSPLILMSFHVPSRTPKPTVATKLHPLQILLHHPLYHSHHPPCRLLPAFHFCSANPVFFTPPNRVSTVMSLLCLEVIIVQAKSALHVPYPLWTTSAMSLGLEELSRAVQASIPLILVLLLRCFPNSHALHLH